MNTITIEEKNLNIPTSWEEVSIQQQMQVDALSKENPDFNSLAIIAGYCGMSIDEVKKMHLQNIKLILDSLTFVSIPLPTDPITEFQYKGETYSVIQSLLKAEFQDFVSLETTLDQHKNDLYKALPYVVAIMAKKSSTGKYESLSDYDIEERQKHFFDLPITIAARVQAFFLNSARLFTVDSQKILESHNLILTESTNNILSMDKKPAGTGIFTRWLMAILRAYIRFLKKSWNTYYYGFNSKAVKQNWITKFKSWCKKILTRK